MSHIDELQVLVDKWRAEEKPEEKPFIEPCPICGGEMKKGRVGNPTHVGEWCEHSWRMPIVIARVMREAKKQVTMYPNDTTIQLKAAVIDLLKLQAKVREEINDAHS